ncbi:PQQ-binding-like beta-propeller repeat protein, partial [Planctomycetota bacterium]
GHMDVPKKVSGALIEWTTGTTPAASDNVPKNTPFKLKQAWKKKAWDTILSGPVSAGSTVAVYSSDSKVHLFDIQSGASKGFTSISNASSGARKNHKNGFAVKNRIIIPVHTSKSMGSDPNALVCIDAGSRKEVWRIPNRAGIFSSINGSEKHNVIGFGSHDTYFHLIDEKTGKEQWKIQTGVSCASGGRYGNNTVYVAGTGGIWGCDIKNGTKKWHVKIPMSFGKDNISIDGTKGLLFAGFAREIACFSIKDGKKKWAVPSVCSAPPAICTTLVLFPLANGKLTALNTGNGIKKWESPLETRYAPACGDGKAAVLSESGRVYVFDGKDGKICAVSEPVFDIGFPVVSTDKGWTGILKTGEVVGLILGK